MSDIRKELEGSYENKMTYKEPDIKKTIEQQLSKGGRKASYYTTRGVKRTTDPINPEHYKKGGIETIKIIRSKLTPEQFEGYCIGNCLKYLTRYKHKNGIEDLKKARWYLNSVIEAGK